MVSMARTVLLMGERFGQRTGRADEINTVLASVGLSRSTFGGSHPVSELSRLPRKPVRESFPAVQKKIWRWSVRTCFWAGGY